jgi:hypothetical protein
VSASAATVTIPIVATTKSEIVIVKPGKTEAMASAAFDSRIESKEVLHAAWGQRIIVLAPIVP